VRGWSEEIRQETALAVDKKEKGKSEAELIGNPSQSVDGYLNDIVRSIEQIEHVISKIATASEEQVATSTNRARVFKEIIHGAMRKTGWVPGPHRVESR